MHWAPGVGIVCWLSSECAAVVWSLVGCTVAMWFVVPGDKLTSLAAGCAAALCVRAVIQGCKAQLMAGRMLFFAAVRRCCASVPCKSQH